MHIALVASSPHPAFLQALHYSLKSTGVSVRSTSPAEPTEPAKSSHEGKSTCTDLQPASTNVSAEHTEPVESSHKVKSACTDLQPAGTKVS